MDATEKSDRKPDSDSRKSRIRTHVLRSLGTPSELLDVKVHPLGSDAYRVNVLTGKNAMASRIADSFYLVTDNEGEVMKSSPEIVRLY